uniref:sensor domain-containing diguanylate cyclase n=1 Tax=Acetatifactor sp. TaxID=1872090 RepID=UPI004056EBDE
MINYRESQELNKIINVAFRAMLDGTGDMVFVKDANLVYMAASVPFVRMTGKQTVEELINRTDLEIFDDENLARRYIADDRKLLAGGENLLDYIEPITEENGHARYGSTSKYILRDEEDNIIGILGITKDITKDYIARQHYQQELRFLFELPIDTYAVSYIDIDDWRIIGQRRQTIGKGMMQACYTIEGLVEAALESIVDHESEAAEFYGNFTKDYLRRIYAEGKIDLSFKYQRLLSDGSTRWVHNIVRFLVDVDSGHLCVMLCAKDIDAQKQEEQKLMEAAQMDRMTMLLNRETTMEHIEQILEEEAEKNHVLFMIDVDNFKKLNDTLGHQAGDEFLIALATEVRKHFRESDVVGRIGGDEFFALMRNVTGVSETAVKAQEVLDAIQKVCAEYAQIHLSGSIGISLYPENGKTLEELYAQADGALYQAKHKGKNQFIFSS